MIGPLDVIAEGWQHKVRHIEYVLFAYRCAPHSNAGVSPFQYICGRDMIGPLDVIAEGWQHKEQEEVRVCE